MTPDTKNRASVIATRVGAVIAFILLISIGMWGSVMVAKNVPGTFSSIATALTSIFVPAGEKIVVSVPSLTVNAGEPFGISWEHVKKSNDGSYTFRYDCADGVSFTSPTASGAPATVFCNVPFNFLNANDSITLTAASANNRFVDVKLYVDFTPNGQSTPTVTGSTTLTIANNEVTGSPAATGTPAPTPTPVPAPAPTPKPTPKPGTGTSNTYDASPLPVISNPNGPIDLSVRIIEQGFIDKDTGAFTASSTPHRSDPTHKIAVRFAVENIGTRTSPQWSFNAVLPTYPSSIFSSPTQQTLAPGDRIEFTLAFDSIVDNDKGTLTINVDPTGGINEPNKVNNIVQYTVTTIK